MFLENFNRVTLFNGETPLQKIENFGNALGHKSLYIKRDDMFELGTGGNKIRSLEFWLGDAIKKNADTILVAGLPPSNLCRLTACASARLSLDCHIVHNASEDEQPEIKTGNPLLNTILGAKAIYCGNVDEYKRQDFVKEYCEELKNLGKTPYIVGDQTLGALGYVNGAKELLEQAKQDNIDIKHIFISASAGPTEAGLVFGICLLAPHIKVHLVSVEYDEKTFFEILDEIFNNLSKATGLIPKAHYKDVVTFYESYLGEGYAKPTLASVAAVKNLASKEGIFIETTYNAKVFAALEDLCQKNLLPLDQETVIFHTGGTAALFGQGQYFK